MKKSLVCAIFCLFVSASSWAQGVGYFHKETEPGGGDVKNPTITVCSSGASMVKQPCDLPVTIYTDDTLVTPQANPFRGDAHGNIEFHVAAGVYVISVGIPYVPGFSYKVNLVTGGTATPGLPVNSLQANINGGLSGTSGITTPDGNSLLIKGPDPFADITPFGARSIPVFSQLATTASCAGTTTITLASDPGFVNGDGITIRGCGSTNPLSTPGAPTVVPSIATGMTGTGLVTNSATGGTTVAYKIVARTKYGALTAASPATTISTSQASLGLQTASVTSAARVNDTVTLTMSGATTIVAGTLIHYHDSSNALFSGFFNVASVSGGGATVVLTNTPYDTRAMGWQPGESASATGGTVGYFLSNHLSWTAVSGAWEYYIYVSRSGGAYSILGVTKPTGNNGWLDVQYDDFGATFAAAQTFPPYVSTSTPPSSATNNPLTTTIVSGAGTTTLVVADAASQTASGQTALLDNAPAILAAANSLASLGTGGYVFIPPSTLTPGNAFYVNSYLLLPVNTVIHQAGKLVLNETVEVQNSLNWSGDSSSAGAPQFGFSGNAYIFLGFANPGIYISGSHNLLNYLNFSGFASNGGTMLVSDGQAENFDYINFNTGATNADYLSMSAMFRDTGRTISNHSFHKVSFTGQVGAADHDSTWTPLLYFAESQDGSGNPGQSDYIPTFKECFFNWRGVVSVNFGGGLFFNADWTYRQSGVMPLYTFSNVTGTLGGEITLKNVFTDTDTSPYVTLLGTGGASVVAKINITGSNGTSSEVTGGNPSIVSGSRPQGLELSSWVGNKLPQNRDSISSFCGSQVKAPPYLISAGAMFGPGCVYNMLQTLSMGSLENIFWPVAPPSSISASSSGVGTWPAGTYTIAVSGTDVTGGESVISATTTVTVDGSHGIQTNWTLPLGAISANGYYCQGTCLATDSSVAWQQFFLHQTGTTTTVAAKASNGPPSNITTAGLPIVASTGMYSQLFAAPETTAPTGIPGFDVLYADAIAHNFKVIANNGSPFTLPGFTISPTNTDCVNWSGVVGLQGDAGGKCATYSVSPTIGNCAIWVTGPKLGDTPCPGGGVGGMDPNMDNMANPTLMNHSLIPAAVNTIAAGSAALPFTNIFLGTVANQAGSFDTSALATNHVIKFPNADATAVVNTPAVSHQFLTQILQATGVASQAQPTLADIAAGAAPAGLFNFAAGTMRIPEASGFVALVNSTLGLDTTANAMHGWINSADAMLSGFASAPAGTKCVQSSGTKGLLAESSLICGTWTDSSTNTGTNKTLSQEGTGNVITVVASPWMRAAGVNNSTAAPAFDLPVTQAPTPNPLTGTNVQKATLDYDDSVNEFAQFDVALPHTWVGNVDINLKWLVTASGGSNAVKWTVQTACSADAATYDTAFNAAQTITTNVAANNIQTVSSQATVTVTGCAVDNVMNFKIGRDITDTFTGTARLVGAQVVLRHTGK